MIMTLKHINFILASLVAGMLVDSTVGDIQQKIHRRASGTESIENVGTLRKSLVTPRPLVPPQGRISDKRKDPRYHRKTKSKKNGDSGNSSDTEQTNSLGMTCQKNIKLKTGESRVCIGEKEAICNDDGWSFGVLNGEAKLFNPENKAVWTMCASVTQICILEDETNPKSTHLMFYNDQEVSGELECKGTSGGMFTTTLHQKRQRMGKNTGRKKGPILKLSKGAEGVNIEEPHAVLLFNIDKKSVWDISVPPEYNGEGTSMSLDEERCTWTDKCFPPCTEDTLTGLCISKGVCDGDEDCNGLAIRFLDAFDSAETPEDALDTLDQHDLAKIMDAVQSNVPEEFKSVITKEYIVKLMFPDPEAIFEIDPAEFGGRSLSVLKASNIVDRHLDLTGDCIKEIVNVLAGMFFLVLQAVKIGVGVAQTAGIATADQLVIGSSTPVYVQLVAGIKQGILLGNHFEVVKLAGGLFGYVWKFYGGRMIVKAIFDNLNGTEVALGVFGMMISVFALVSSNFASIILEVALLGVSIAYLVIAFQNATYECSQEACNVDQTGEVQDIDCDDLNACTIDSTQCEEGEGWFCVNTPISCPPGFSCDPIDGKCKNADEILFCVAVIDEDTRFGTPNQEALWAEFESRFPFRPFCLLVPDIPGTVQVPPAFTSNYLTVVHYNVPRDFGDPAKAADWVGLCEIDKYTKARVALFIDDSGSLEIEDVQASYDNFKSKLNEYGTQVIDVVNPDENWILPFLDTLVPAPTCVAGSEAGVDQGLQGVCVGTSDCLMPNRPIPWSLGDDSPNCFDYPADVQCCMTPPPCVSGSAAVVDEGRAGVCVHTSDCISPKRSIPWSDGDDTPNCFDYHADVQCCI